ncbi:MAG: hypothetical protein KKA05_03110 [Alphaproteobacteria bacterium]|nr:hypothetical protein [Alphaproteobacteria bacterium]
MRRHFPGAAFIPDVSPSDNSLRRVTFIRPGGNDTALVWDSVPHTRQAALSRALQSQYPTIEQVMFVEQDPLTGALRGQMAGGEFCGNAARSLGYLLLGGRDGRISLDISGSCRPATVIVKNGLAAIDIPVQPSLDCVQEIEGGEFIINLDGISFLITTGNQRAALRMETAPDLSARKSCALDILCAYGLADNLASGLLVVTGTKNLSVDPYVFVRDTGTLYYETGCGSGAAAIGLMMAKQSGNGVLTQDIRQPSGMILSVTITRSQSQFLRAQVSGDIKIIGEGSVTLNNSQINKAL